MSLPIAAPSSGQRTDQLWKPVAAVIRTAAPATEVDKLKQDTENLRQLLRRHLHGDGAVEIRRFTIVDSTAADYLKCTWINDDGTNGAEDEYTSIAKEAEVRGATVRETLDDNNQVTYRETVHPQFSGVIYAARCANKTSVIGHDALECEWFDLTTRFWKPGLVALDLCRLIGGVETTFRVSVWGGPIHGPIST